MRISVNPAVANSALLRLESANMQTRVGRTVNDVTNKDLTTKIDQRCENLCEQTRELYDVKTKGSFISKVAIGIAAVGTFCAAAATAGGAAAAFGATGLSMALFVGVTVAVPVGVCSFIAWAIGKGIGMAVTEGDKDDAAAAENSAGVLKVMIKDDERIKERAGTGNVDKGRDDANNAWEQIFSLGEHEDV